MNEKGFLRRHASQNTICIRFIRALLKHFSIKIICLFLVVSSVIPLTACESREEKQRKAWDSALDIAEKKAQEARDDYIRSVEWGRQYEYYRSKIG